VPQAILVGSLVAEDRKLEPRQLGLGLCGRVLDQLGQLGQRHARDAHRLRFLVGEERQVV
jgi:hypothetical protein